MDEKKSFDELKEELKEAAKLVTPGGYYAHYKHPEIPYLVKGFAVAEVDNEIAVRYSSTQEPLVEFVRPLSVWNETVEWNGKVVPRFMVIT
jgi:hypothetical protein